MGDTDTPTPPDAVRMRETDERLARAMGLDVLGWHFTLCGDDGPGVSPVPTDRKDPVFVRSCLCNDLSPDPIFNGPHSRVGKHSWHCCDVVPFYTQSLDAVAEAELEVARRGLDCAYGFKVFELMTGDIAATMEVYDGGLMAKIITAPAWVRAAACVAVLSKAGGALKYDWRDVKTRQE